MLVDRCVVRDGLHVKDPKGVWCHVTDVEPLEHEVVRLRAENEDLKALTKKLVIGKMVESAQDLTLLDRISESTYFRSALILAKCFVSRQQSDAAWVKGEGNPALDAEYEVARRAVFEDEFTNALVMSFMPPVGGGRGES